MKKRILVLFDIDGTLLLSGGAGNRSIDRALMELFSLENATRDILFVGRTDKLIFQEIVEKKLNKAINDPLRQKISSLYLQYLRKEVSVSPGFQVLDGVRELIEKLGMDGRFVLGIATGNIEEGAWIKLERAGLKKHFSFGGFDEDGFKRSEIVMSAMTKALKNYPEGFEKVILVGDSPFDVEAAKEAGIVSIAVGTDGFDKYELKKNAPDFYFDSLKNTSEIIKSIL